MIMRKVTPEGNRVVMVHITDPSNYDSLALIRYLALGFDYRLYKEDLVAGEIVVFNMESFKPQHYPKLFDINCFKFTKFALMNYPFRLKNIFVLNCHPLMEKGVTITKSVLPQKLADRVTIVTSKDINKHIPPECLPVEFGGTDRSMERISQDVMELFVKEEAFIQEISKVKPTGPVPEEFKAAEHEFGIDGSFRKLNID